MASAPDKDKPTEATLVSAVIKTDRDSQARTDVISYTLDKAGVIVAVNNKWDEFARDNDGEKILSGKIIGKKLDQFIHGDVTRMFVRAMIMSARTLKRPVYRPYRCDSPQLKRFMEMTVLPQDAGTVEVIHRQLHSEPIVNKFSIRAAPEGSGSILSSFIKRCSLCNRVKAKGIWSEIDEAVEESRLDPPASTLKVIYGVCPDCLVRGGVPL
jgi:hypothetical protein